MFITFEGIDFSGKSTQCRLLGKFLKDKGYNTLLLREPGGTEISEKIRKLLLDKGSDGMFPLTEFLLYNAARAQVVEEVIKPAHDSGKTVICDRFYDSSTAYQGYGRGLPIKDVEFVNNFSTGGLEPDLTIIVDISVAESLRRLKLTGKQTDRIESEGTEFFETVRQGYLQIATRNSSLLTHKKHRFKVVNGEDDINTVKRKIQEIVISEFENT
ncbi:MAG: dTMP kinase [candidate division Zixibacteria bacterium]|nr:dTMP kinase [candidate division Zixibacteria bacterium]